MELSEKIARGFQAKEILEADIYVESYALLKQEITRQWQQSPARDSEGREKLYLMIGLLDKLQSLMQSTLETGMLAQEQLKHNQSLLYKAKAYLRPSQY